MSDDFHTRHRQALANYIRQQMENKVISTVPVGTVFQFSRGLNQYAIKCSRRGEAEGFVEVMVVVGKGLYTVLQVPTTELQILPNQAQYETTPLVQELRKRLEQEQFKAASTPQNKSDGSTASYYQLPENCKELQDLISHRNMNAQMGEIFRATYRFGMASHSDQLRDAKKIKFYIEAEIKRLENANGAA